jgi:hypothetical protein
MLPVASGTLAGNDGFTFSIFSLADGSEVPAACDAPQLVSPISE